MITLENRLIAWGEWSRRSGRSRQATGSLEGEYRPPQPWEKPPEPVGSGYNVDDCECVELAWSTLDPQDKVFLRCVYCKRHSRGKTLFLSGGVVGKELRYHHWVEVYTKAHQAIEQALNRGEARNHGLLRQIGNAVLGVDEDELARRGLDISFAPA